MGTPKPQGLDPPRFKASGTQPPLPDMPISRSFGHLQLAGTRVVCSKTKGLVPKSSSWPNQGVHHPPAVQMAATGLAKSTLQHTLSFGTAALASKRHLFTPILMLIIYISVTNCSWEAFRHGHMKDSKKPTVCFGGSCCGYYCGWDPASPSPSRCATRHLAARCLPLPATSLPHGKPRGSPHLCFNL